VTDFDAIIDGVMRERAALSVVPDWGDTA
jgi:hypothetical protein